MHFAENGALFDTNDTYFARNDWVLPGMSHAKIDAYSEE